MRKLTLIASSAAVAVVVFGTTAFAADNGNGKKAVEALQGNGKKAVEALKAQIQSLENEVQTLTVKLTADDNTVAQQKATIDAQQSQLTQDQTTIDSKNQTIAQQQSTINTQQDKLNNSYIVPKLKRGMTIDEVINLLGQPTTRNDYSSGQTDMMWDFKNLDNIPNGILPEEVVNVGFRNGQVFYFSYQIMG